MISLSSATTPLSDSKDSKEKLARSRGGRQKWKQGASLSEEDLGRLTAKNKGIVKGSNDNEKDKDKVAKITDKDKEAAMRDTKQKGIEIRTHHASELAELTRSHRRKTFATRQAEDTAGLAARRSATHDESPEISQDNLSYDLKGIEKWDDEMDAVVVWAAADQTVHAYHAIRGEACLDSGANLNIFQLENEPHMSDMVNSDITVSGFSGKEEEWRRRDLG